MPSAFPQDSQWVEEKQLLMRTNQELQEKVRAPAPPRASLPGSTQAVLTFIRARFLGAPGPWSWLCPGEGSRADLDLP